MNQVARGPQESASEAKFRDLTESWRDDYGIKPQTYGSQGHPVCEKCGERFHTRRRYRPEHRSLFRKRLVMPEHFFCFCRCGFSWKEAVDG